MAEGGIVTRVGELQGTPAFPLARRCAFKEARGSAEPLVSLWWRTSENPALPARRCAPRRVRAFVYFPVQNLLGIRVPERHGHKQLFLASIASRSMAESCYL